MEATPTLTTRGNVHSQLDYHVDIYYYSHDFSSFSSHDVYARVIWVSNVVIS